MAQDKDDVEQFEEFASALAESSYIKGKPLKQRKSEFDVLVGRVEKINYAAGQYLKDEARKLSTFKYDGKLFNVFNWGQAPQGTQFWLAIHDQLVRRETH